MSMNLYDRASVLSHDSERMLDVVEAFPYHCTEAVNLGHASRLPDMPGRPAVVALAGMGGSSVGGDYVRVLFEQSGLVPFAVIRDDRVPSYVGLGDLAFIVSYSGETEETLAAYHSARRAGAKVVVITSGGRLSEQARQDKVALVQVPAGLPPRGALPYLCLPVVVSAERLKLLPAQNYERLAELMKTSCDRWKPESVDAEARTIAEALAQSWPVIHGTGAAMSAAAIRWRNQFQENAKRFAHANAYPELLHNEVEAWGNDVSDAWTLVTLDDGSGSPEVRARMEAFLSGLRDRVKQVRLTVPGETQLERMFAAGYLGDWVSIYLAALSATDPSPIPQIARLKAVSSPNGEG